MKCTRYGWRMGAVLLVACAIAGPLNAAGSRPVTSGTIKSLVVPADTVYKGMTMGEWSALWWQWVFTQPMESNPILQQSGPVSMTEQGGPVYFLGGIFGGAFPTAVRSATIPANTSLFFPVVNSVWGNGGFVGTDVPEGWGPTKWSVGFLRAGLAAGLPDTSKMWASLDGVPIRNMEDCRVQSPAFATMGPETGRNIWMVVAPAGVDWQFVDAWPTLSDGYWLMLRPLPAGQHVLKFGQPGMDITYNLNVLGGGTKR